MVYAMDSGMAVGGAGVTNRKYACDDYTFYEGERIIIELKDTSIYEGDYAGGSKNRIDIINAFVYPESFNNIVFKDILSFYKLEIESVRRFKQVITRHLRNKDVHKVIPLTYKKFHCLLNAATSFQYLTKKHLKYIQAIKYLEICETIGVVALGRKSLVSTGVDYLVFSTFCQVFIFDLHSLERGYIPDEIRELLEKESIEKVIHNPQDLVCFLRNSLKIEIKNVFDTGMADFLIHTQRNGIVSQEWRSLSECLSDYFNFPNSLVENKTLNLVWDKHPLNDFCKLRASLLAGYLIPFRNTLENIMLKKYYNSVKMYSNSLFKEY